MQILGNVVDIRQRKIFPASVFINGDKIVNISPITDPTQAANVPKVFIMPGFVDAHVHVESSMLVPTEFARMAAVHGTVATVSDPHEIANVLGMAGVEYMLENANQTPFKFAFGAPSCVPATPFETAGATLGIDEVKQLLERNDIYYLSEMMNWPGVLKKNKEVMAKIRLAKEIRKPVDGHAPGLKGQQALNYIKAGISTDHECFTEEEALDKLKYGMKVLVREGSAAKNFEALISLLPKYYFQMMFCSDDKHPDNLAQGHINQLAARAVAKGQDLFQVLQVACLNPVSHYKLPVGTLRPGDAADFIIVQDLRRFQVLRTYINGKVVAEMGKPMLPSVEAPNLNNFTAYTTSPEDFAMPAPTKHVVAMVPEDGQLVTGQQVMEATVVDGMAVADTEKDLLKISVVNRYTKDEPAMAFITGFGLKRGAIAGSVAHDSHNIIAIGADDASLSKAVNTLMESKGGLVAVDGDIVLHLPLPVAGLMTTEDGWKVAEKYTALHQQALAMGASMTSPYMTLSFMALLVIPTLKLSDKGLFNGKKFEFTDVFVPEPKRKGRAPKASEPVSGNS